MSAKYFFSFAWMLISALALAQNPLAIPDTLSGTSFTLSVYDTSRVFYTSYTTNTYGINSSYLGPTLILKKGDSISISVNNYLADTTTVHWHGLHVASPNDGGPHTVVPPSTSWNPKFKVRDLAGTYWYHPHLHMMTGQQVVKGAAGLIILRDSTEATINLPRGYGIDDFPVIIQSKAFDAGKQITIANAYDSVMMVNGTLKPYLQAPAQVIRLRLLNASAERVYNCGFTGNMNFYQIASDGGLLQNPVALTRLRLAPGERAELLVNLVGMQGQTLNLLSYASEFPNGIYGASNPAAMGGGVIPGYSSNVLNGANFTILQIQVGAQTSNPVTTVPSSLTTVTPWNTGQANTTRSLSFNPKTMGANQMVNGPFVINNVSFDMNVINYTIPKDNIEIWQLNNQTAIAHPFHIHDVQFYVFEINGSTPPPNLQGRKDVILVPAQQTVKFITRFETFCDSVPYMYHCHMLKHEDEGMMGQFRVGCSLSGIEEHSAQVLTFPNPAGERLHVDLHGFSSSRPVDVVVYDAAGNVVYTATASPSLFILDLSPWRSGLYTIRFSDGEKDIKKKIVIQ